MSIQTRGKIGYALGGGGARGIAHVGVLKVLEDHGVFPDVMAGTSIGALAGALYSSGFKAEELEQLALSLNWRQLARLADVTLPTRGLVQGRRVSALLRSVLGDLTFSDLKIPFACVATDILRGEEVVLGSGSLIMALRASISVPGILTPVKMGDRYLVDGGLVNQVPVSLCRKMGAEYVVGVNVVPNPADMLQYSPVKKSKDKAGTSGRIRQPSGAGVEEPNGREVRPPSMAKVLGQASLIPGYRLAKENLRDADLVISPAVGMIGFLQFGRAVEAIAEGENAARSALESLLCPRHAD